MSGGRLTEIIALTRVGVWDCDLTNGTFVCNGHWEKMFGYTPGVPHRARQDFLSRLHPEDEERVLGEFASAMEYRKAFDLEFRVLWADGSVHWLHARGCGIRKEDGSPHRLVATFFDIGARKRDEEDRQRQTEAIRLQAQSLGRCNDALAQFAQLASHDLKEPIRTVHSYVELLQADLGPQLTPDTRQYMEFILDGTRRMQQMIHDLSTFAKVEGASPPVTPVEMDSAFEQAKKSLEPRLQASGASLSKTELPVLPGMQALLVQLWTILLDNALKFRSEEALKIDVTVQKSTGEWVFTVADNGLGFDPRFAQRVFQTFQRLHSRSKFPGSGMGLAIAKKIVEKHGGRIWVESTPGEGSRFHFTLLDPTS
jgi:PAS domain S-box-containing protein